jgi:YVTN family beta-propeller protein
MIRYFLAAISILLLMVSCNEKDLPAPYGQFSNSVFVINEGPYPAGTGTISAFDRETKLVTPDLFGSANGKPLGNVVQSMTVYGDKAFIVVNNANKIEVVNVEDFKSVATIENLTFPRYLLAFDESKAYVSCWDSTVKVINLHNYTVTASLQVGTGPNEMIVSNGRLFVINSGVADADSTVSVIRTDGDESLGKIVVGHRPAGIRKDKNGKIWVLCSGRGWNGYPAPGDTPARLVCFDPVSLELLKAFTFTDSRYHPDNLVVNKNGDMLFYYSPGGIYSFAVSATSLNSQPFIVNNASLYSLGFDEKLNMIYAGDPLDYAQNGWFYRYNAQDGSLVDYYMVGMMPNGFWFN